MSQMPIWSIAKIRVAGFGQEPTAVKPEQRGGREANRDWPHSIYIVLNSVDDHT